MMPVVVERIVEMDDPEEVASLRKMLSGAEGELVAAQAFLRRAFDHAWNMGMIHGEPLTSDDLDKMRAEFERWMSDNGREREMRFS